MSVAGRISGAGGLLIAVLLLVGGCRDARCPDVPSPWSVEDRPYVAFGCATTCQRENVTCWDEGLETLRERVRENEPVAVATHGPASPGGSNSHHWVVDADGSGRYYYSPRGGDVSGPADGLDPSCHASKESADPIVRMQDGEIELRREDEWVAVDELREDEGRYRCGPQEGAAGAGDAGMSDAAAETGGGTDAEVDGR